MRGALILTLVVTFCLASPWAYGKKKNKEASHPESPEIYSAIEDGSPAAPQKQKPAPKRATPKFDEVPADQVEPLTRRLALVEELIRKYHRAYDYRVHTTRELEAILGELNAKSAEKETPPPPPPAQSE